MNEKLNECIKIITEQNNLIHKILETVVDKDNANKVATNFTYSEILKNNRDAILIKPKKDGQKSQETEKDIRKKIDPSELAVGIETIKTVGKGSVVINCSDNSSKEKLRENVKKTIGNKYEIIDPKLKHPKVIVTRVEKDIVDESNEKILEAIITQNELINIDENNFDVAAKRQARNLGRERNRNIQKKADWQCHKLYGALRVASLVQAGNELCAKLTRVQRLTNIRIASAYRTISTYGIIAGVPLIELLVEERRARYDGVRKTAAREALYERWQDKWRNGRYAAWTSRLIREVRKWVERPCDETDYVLPYPSSVGSRLLP
ncbi:sentrin/sumo-specific protease [Holotrichia oblita]|uniref:Sentrin/sumo-specific protease n=1 Tax=Holotrichia oblita TaxID=644536 RepID=A0ACB9THR1_HOLOL|nr:sentrin/sumo-specific protease [Holotrichia oblita]